MGSRQLQPKEGHANSGDFISPFACLAVVCGVFLVLTNLGLAYQREVATFVQSLIPRYSALLTDQNVIYSLWIAVLGVHAAVGAVAPILGYTLFATTITSASRVAPSGAVIAAEIGWSKYLQLSLTLLAGSILGVLSAPSAVGLGLAGFSTVMVVVRTLWVFKKGFDLIARPELFDKGARKYLAQAVSGLSDSPLDKNLRSSLDSLNTDLASIRRASRIDKPTEPLFMGDRLQATQLLKIQKDSVEILISEAKKLRLDIHFDLDRCPEYLSRGESRFFLVSGLGPRVSVGVGHAPSVSADVPPEPQKVAQLQKVARKLIEYGSGGWIESFVRAPMLVHRHVATVIYEAIPNHRPHDLEYGLDVLGDVIDATGLDKKSASNPSSMGQYQWIFEIPTFVCGHIERTSEDRWRYGRDLAKFLQGRLVKWLEHPQLDSFSLVYVKLLVRIFGLIVSTNLRDGAVFAGSLRALFYVEKSKRREAVQLIERELVLLLVGEVSGISLTRAERRVVIKCALDILSSTRDRSQGELYVETFMGALALSLFLAREDGIKTELIADLLDALDSSMDSRISMALLLSSAISADEVSERWKWSWWEIDQKETGVAHLVEIDDFLARAAMLAMAPRSWELAQIPDQDLPAQYAIDRLVRLVDSDDWRSLLPAGIANSMGRLKDELVALSRRRGELVAAGVAAAAIDGRKASEYVNSELGAAESDMRGYSEWVASSCILTPSDEIRPNLQFGIASLLPKDCFVTDEVLDTSVMIGTSGLGHSIEEFELRKLIDAAEQIGAEHRQVKSTSAPDIWRHLSDLIAVGAHSVWMVGLGVSEFDLWENLESAKRMARDAGVLFRFDNVGGAEGLRAGVLVIDSYDNVEFVRYLVDGQAEAIAEGRLPPASGGLHVSLSEITQEMQEEWLRNESEDGAAKLRERYRMSVVMRSTWSFTVSMRRAQAQVFFEVDA